MTSTAQTHLRNVCIIAHVDHGKTTLVDAMLKQTGVFRAGQEVAERVMDSNDLERERGITILAKQCSVRFPTKSGEVKINIIDTPGHADFGGEVERTLRMADGVILLVDAAEGPLPQTRFVLGKSLELGHRVIVVINKIDRPDARPDEVLNEVFDLFVDLEASDEQTDFPVLYAIGKQGVCKRKLEDTEMKDLRPLFETIVETVAPPKGDPDAPLQMLVNDIQADEYVGRLAVGRIVHGRVSDAQTVMRMSENGPVRSKVTKVYGFESMNRVAVGSAGAGDIVALAGVDEVQIGDTIADAEKPTALPRIRVEEPTLKVTFLVNTGAFAGKVGKFVTSRQLRERLEREAMRNLAMRFEPTDSPDQFTVFGRGELMITILLETMRREGYEMAVGMPEVVIKEIDGQKMEPVERVVVDVPEQFVGTVTTNLGQRRGQMIKMTNLGFGRARMEFRVPSRGLIGFRGQFLTDTRGTGLLNTLFDGWEPYAGAMNRRINGAMVADRMGECTAYALDHLQPRGVLFVSPGVAVYEGMIVGEHNRENDLDVNIIREKKLSNVRSKNKDDNVVLQPPRIITLEYGLEFINRDELMEVTPDAIRLRKKVLEVNKRPRRDDEHVG
jgi:GTP-binding protein